MEGIGARRVLTKAEDDHVDSNDDRLAVKQALGLAQAGAQRVAVLDSLAGGRVWRRKQDTYKPMGKNCEMPPRTIITATARLTMRLQMRARYVSKTKSTLLLFWGGGSCAARSGGACAAPSYGTGVAVGCAGPAACVERLTSCRRSPC